MGKFKYHLLCGRENGKRKKKGYFVPDMLIMVCDIWIYHAIMYLFLLFFLYKNYRSVRL